MSCRNSSGQSANERSQEAAIQFAPNPSPWAVSHICKLACQWLHTPCSHNSNPGPPQPVLCAPPDTPHWIAVSAAAAHASDSRGLSAAAADAGNDWISIDNLLADSSAQLTSVSRFYDSSLWRRAKYALHRDTAPSAIRQAAQVRTLYS